MNYEELKKMYIDNIKDFMCETGGINTMITVFGEDIEVNKPAIIHIPVPSKFLESDESKDEFVDEIIPEIFKEIKKRIIPLGVGWASEAWMRTTEDFKDVRNWKNLPIKKEVLIITIETNNDKQGYLFDIKRKGKQVDSHGDLIDIIELEEDLSFNGGSIVDGRFTKLFNKL